MKRPLKEFDVILDGNAYVARARSHGNAARQIFRHLLRRGILKRQPETDRNSGGWKDVIVNCTGPAARKETP